MKTISKQFRLLATTAAFGALVSFAQAGPGVGYWRNLGSQSQLEQQKPGAKTAYVCTECKTDTKLPVTSKQQSMDYCKVGSTVTCPSCHKTTKTVMKRGRNEPANHKEVVYTNDKGKECAFIAVNQ